MQVSGQNSVADLLQEQGLVLGIDFDRDNAKASHPAVEEVRALDRAGVGAWLNSEIEQPDDSISEPPAALRDYLSDHREAIWNIVARSREGLSRLGPPARRGSLADPHSASDDHARKECSSSRRSARSERGVESRQSEPWKHRGPSAHQSLYRVNASSLVSPPATSRDWEGGVLRKMKASPVQWMTRMSGEKPWVELLDACPGGRLRSKPLRAHRGTVQEGLSSREAGSRGCPAQDVSV